MKKITLAALAAMMLAPSASFADSWVKEVTNATELKTALNTIGAGVAGETYEIICNWEPGVTETLGKFKPTMVAGTLYLHSNETDFSKMPTLNIAFEWNADMTAKNEAGKNMSVIIENLNIKGNGSYLIDDRRDIFADTIRLKRCDIDGVVRSILRYDGDKGTKTAAEMSIDVIEVKECVLHNTAQASGDNWSVFRAFMPVNTLTFENNMFYNSPYTKSILETRNPADVQSTINFNNNMVLLGENKEVSTGGFTVLMTGSTLSAGSTFNVNNNIFIGPKAGYNTLHSEESTYKSTKITNATNAVVLANNNVIDEESYQTFEQLQTTLDAIEGSSTIIVPGLNYSLPEDFSWDAGKTFQEADKNMYYILNSNPWKTAGINPETSEDGYYVGPSIAYIDEFPTAATLSINIVGPKYISYTVSPEKAQYYVNDEVTIKLNSHNSMYRQFNVFKGWSDGETEETRTLKLAETNDLTATFEEDGNVVAAFDFSTITANNSLASYDADIYYNMDETYKATVSAIVNDTLTTKTAPFPYVNGTFQGRPAKFGEDEASMQMHIISRRTAAIAKETQRDYALVEFSTKGMNGINVSAFVGTDNNAAKIQALDYSTDGENWTRGSEIEIENGLWSELECDLPETFDNQDKVYVRFIGDLKDGHIITNDPSGGLVDANGKEDEAAYLGADAFEYIGNILISAKTASGIVNVNAAAEKAIDANAPIYNMMGMKVAKGTKGLLIQNGKKVIVK